MTLYINTKFTGIEQRSKNLLSKIQIDGISDLVTNKLFYFLDSSSITKLRSCSESKIMTILLLRCFYIDLDLGNPLSLDDKIKLSFLLYKNGISVSKFKSYFSEYRFIELSDEYKEYKALIQSWVENENAQEKRNYKPFQILDAVSEFIDISYPISPKDDLIGLITSYLNSDQLKHPPKQPDTVLDIFKKISFFLCSAQASVENRDSSSLHENYIKAQILFDSNKDLLFSANETLSGYFDRELNKLALFDIHIRNTRSSHR